jgi:hypothetical protein
MISFRFERIYEIWLRDYYYYYFTLLFIALHSMKLIQMVILCFVHAWVREISDVDRIGHCQHGRCYRHVQRISVTIDQRLEIDGFGSSFYENILQSDFKLLINRIDKPPLVNTLRSNGANFAANVSLSCEHAVFRSM